MPNVILEVTQIMPAAGWFFDGYWESGYPDQWLPVVCFALVKTRDTEKMQFSATETRIIPLSPDNAFDYSDLVGKEVPTNINVIYRPNVEEFSQALQEEGQV